MSETLINVPDPIGEIQKECQGERIEALRASGFEGWFSQLESEFNKGLIPNLIPEEGRAIADKFANLSELVPSQPSKSTETPIMEAIAGDLKVVFGEKIEPEIDTLIAEQLMPLRGSGEISDEPNKFLAIAVENILRDVVAVARAFQLTDSQLKELYPDENPEQMRAASLENLKISLLTRSLKGEARKKGLCKKAMHEEHIWMIRGVRDVPPSSLKVIGKFIDDQLAS